MFAPGAAIGAPREGTCRSEGSNPGSKVPLHMAANPLAEPHRTYDPDNFRRRAGCIALLPSDGGPRRVVLSSSSSKAGHWVVPAGGIDHGESPETAAVREAHEEAGIRATPGAAKFICWIENVSKLTRTAVYLVDPVEGLDDSFPESHLRTRTCVTLAEAELLLAKSASQLTLLQTAVGVARERHLLPASEAAESACASVTEHALSSPH